MATNHARTLFLLSIQVGVVLALGPTGNTSVPCPEGCINFNSTYFECIDSGCVEFPLLEIETPLGVTYIDVSFNGLVEVPVLDLPELVHLDLSNNEIANIEEDAFDMCVKLRHLNISGNAIASLSSHWKWSGISLETFDLSSNVISDIHDNFFFHMTALIVLDLHNNSLRNLSMNSLFGLNTILDLNLDGNAFKEINVSYFLGLTSLQHLSLRKNLISVIGRSSFNDLDSLLRLDLGENKLKTLSFDMFHPGIRHPFSTLQAIYLDHNQITVIHNHTFSPCINLEYIFLDHNPITTIRENEPFPDSLKIFSMRQNKYIKKIANGTFTGLTKLEKVDISGCYYLHEIEPAAFDGGDSSLQTFDASHAGLYSLPAGLLNWYRVKDLHLAGNPWTCDCDLVWMKEELEENITDTITCSYPHQLKGRTLSSLETDDLTCSMFSRYRHRMAIALVGAATVVLLVGITYLAIAYRQTVFAPCKKKQKAEYQTLFNTAEEADDPAVSIQWENSDSETSALKGKPPPIAV